MQAPTRSLLSSPIKVMQCNPPWLPIQLGAKPIFTTYLTYEHAVIFVSSRPFQYRLGFESTVMLSAGSAGPFMSPLGTVPIAVRAGGTALTKLRADVTVRIAIYSMVAMGWFGCAGSANLGLLLCYSLSYHVNAYVREALCIFSRSLDAALLVSGVAVSGCTGQEKLTVGGRIGPTARIQGPPGRSIEAPITLRAVGTCESTCRGRSVILSAAKTVPGLIRRARRVGWPHVSRSAVQLLTKGEYCPAQHRRS